MHEKFGQKFFSQSKPVWLGDLGRRQKNKNKNYVLGLYIGITFNRQNVFFEYSASMLKMRSSRVVRESHCQCQSRNSPGFYPSILRHGGIWVVAEVAVLNNVLKKKTSHFFAWWWKNLEPEIEPDLDPDPNPDPYLWLTNPDANPGGPKTYRSYRSGSGCGSGSTTLPSTITICKHTSRVRILDLHKSYNFFV
jgi:hypothetical protein